MRSCFRVGPAAVSFTSDFPPIPLGEFVGPFEIAEKVPAIDLAIQIRTGPPPEENGLPQVGEYEGNWRLFRRSEGWRLQVFDSMTHSRIKQVILISEEFSQADVFLIPESSRWAVGGVMAPFFEWWLTGWLSLRKQGMILHGCAMEREGMGLAFFGPSGAGKTTLSKLFLESGGDGWTVLNDERILVWKEEDGWHVGGTPWTGMLGKASPAIAPLAGVFTLRKSSENKIISPLTPGFLAEIISESFHPIWSREATEGLLSTAARLAEDLPTGEFHFRKDASAVEFLKGFLPRSCTPSLSISQ